MKPDEKHTKVVPCIKTSQNKPLHTTIRAPASYYTMVLDETMGIKRFIQLIIKKNHWRTDGKLQTNFHNVLTDEQMGGYGVKG